MSDGAIEREGIIGRSTVQWVSMFAQTSVGKQVKVPVHVDVQSYRHSKHSSVLTLIPINI